MLKIIQERVSGSVLLRLEGLIIGPWVEELGKTCGRTMDEGDLLILDLEGVGFVDRRGAALIRDLDRRRVSILNCPRFVQEQIRAEES